jgi:class 3 adenylate cyclase
MAECARHAYVCAGDILHFVSGTENGDEAHASSLVALARKLNMLSAIMSLPGGQPLQFQMGMHTGQLVTGVVGNRSLKYGYEI